MIREVRRMLASVHDCTVYWTVTNALFKNAVNLRSVTRNEIERRYLVDRPFCRIARKSAIYFRVGWMSVFNIDTKLFKYCMASMLIWYFSPFWKSIICERLAFLDFESNLTIFQAIFRYIPLLHRYRRYDIDNYNHRTA